MEERYSRLEITPKIIDFGTRVVQMKLVTSAGLRHVHPWRTMGKILFGLAIVLFITSVNSAASIRLFRSSFDTSLYLISSVVVLVAALFCLLFTRHLLVVQLADSDKIVLAAAKQDFLQSIVDRIREAMLAPTDAPIHYTVNVTAQTIEARSLVDMSRSTVSHSPGAAVIAGNAHGPVGTRVNGHAATDGGVSNSARAYRSGIAYPLPHDEGVGSHGAGAPQGPPHAAQFGSSHPASPAQGGDAPSVSVHGSPGGVAIGTAIGASVHTQVSVGQDLQQMIVLIERARVPDQERVIEYLRLLQQLAAAGPARAAEARTTWLTFFEYAAKALSGVDGFLAVAERVHRWFMARG